MTDPVPITIPSAVSPVRTLLTRSASQAKPIASRRLDTTVKTELSERAHQDPFSQPGSSCIPCFGLGSDTCVAITSLWRHQVRLSADFRRVLRTEPRRAQRLCVLRPLCSERLRLLKR